MPGLARLDAASGPPERLQAGQGEAMRLTVHQPDGAGREQIEQFIYRVYKKSYGASVQSYAPVLLSLADESGRITAAAGYRIASTGPLFLENYLSAPIESLIRTHASVPRGRIAEVGHLSSEQSGAGRRLIKLIGWHLADLGLQWVSRSCSTSLSGSASRQLRWAQPIPHGSDQTPNCGEAITTITQSSWPVVSTWP